MINPVTLLLLQHGTIHVTVTVLNLAPHNRQSIPVVVVKTVATVLGVPIQGLQGLVDLPEVVEAPPAPTDRHNVVAVAVADLTNIPKTIEDGAIVKVATETDRHGEMIKMVEEVGVEGISLPADLGVMLPPLLSTLKVLPGKITLHLKDLLSLTSLRKHWIQLILLGAPQSVQGLQILATLIVIHVCTAAQVYYVVLMLQLLTTIMQTICWKRGINGKQNTGGREGKKWRPLD